MSAYKYRERRKRIRIAGMPALLAAVVLTINCCHGASYICAPGFASQAGDAAQVSGDRATRTPAPCHAPASASSSNKEREPQPAKAAHSEFPGKPPSDSHDSNRDDCSGCDPLVALLDAHSPRSELDRAAHRIDFEPAIHSNRHGLPIPDAALRPPPPVGPALHGGAEPLYVLIQSFLI